MRTKFIALATCFALSLSVYAAVARSAGGAGHGASVTGVTPDAALLKLQAGNARFVGGKPQACAESGAAARARLAKGQKPHTIVLSCSDSRLPPELVFDQAQGELFVVRVAGNIPDPIVLGSIEYAALHLGSSLVLVLGHERCGAVTAAVEAKGTPKGNVGAIVKTIAPAVAAARKTCPAKDQPGLVECAVDENTRLVAKTLTKDSPVLKRLVDAGKLKIATAKYDLDDGKVTVGR